MKGDLEVSVSDSSKLRSSITRAKSAAAKREKWAASRATARDAAWHWYWAEQIIAGADSWTWASYLRLPDVEVEDRIPEDVSFEDCEDTVFPDATCVGLGSAGFDVVVKWRREDPPERYEHYDGAIDAKACVRRFNEEFHPAQVKRWYRRD